MKAAVVVFPGSNCDREAELPDVDLVVLPGGFSYGDYLRSGAMAAHSPVMRAVVARAEKGVAVLGICNGFQILTEAGLLPGALMRNAGLRFICRDLWVRTETRNSRFTHALSPGSVHRFPAAHNEGNYFIDDAGLAALEDADRIAFRYATPEGEVTEAANPNGSRDSIAGVLNGPRNVLGLMPHPERLADPAVGGTDGRRFFESVVSGLS